LGGQKSDTKKVLVYIFLSPGPRASQQAVLSTKADKNQEKQSEINENNAEPSSAAPQAGARFARGPLGLLIFYFWLVFLVFCRLSLTIPPADWLGPLGRDK